MESLALTVSIVEKVTIIVGVLSAILLILHRRKTAKISEANLKLKNWELLRNLIDEDTNIRKLTFDFMEKYDYREELKVENLKSKYRNGELIYLSSELNEFNQIGRYYEQLSASLRMGYLPIDLLFEVIPFPDSFWQKTIPLRNEISATWFGDDSPLDDFWENFSWMQKEWHKRRKNS